MKSPTFRIRPAPSVPTVLKAAAAAAAAFGLLPRGDFVVHGFVADNVPNAPPPQLFAARTRRLTTKVRPRPFIDDCSDYGGYAVNCYKSPFIKKGDEHARSFRGDGAGQPEKQEQKQAKPTKYADRPTDFLPERISKAVSPPKP